MTDRSVDSSRPERLGVALVTGAAGGIGRELSRQFARHGHDVIAVDRDEAGLARLERDLGSEPGTVVATVALDLTEPDASARVAGRVDETGRAVDTLVNNAGVPVYGPFAETDWADERAMIRLNVEALTALTDQFLDDMCDRGRGRILNVASIAGTVPTPTAAVYGATKAYVLSFSLALAEELAGERVTVTALCPGETDTGFMRRGGMERSAVAGGDLLEAETVAKAGYEGAMAGSRIVVPGRRDRVRYHLSKLLSRRFAARLTRRVWSGSR
ncbi:SDR family NAD(P)-dependent oxidoreductase [Natronobeatus ordinarius]|uniref:SDR family NAD(P)-dependent oxidoreductase n=1 Tax=Natronobeatus ordinarius TaxID=2963433 RepID=UPI0020CDC161|nr:SDR family oxidoreductase [Natronobeatus ordinarius]